MTTPHRIHAGVLVIPALLAVACACGQAQSSVTLHGGSQVSGTLLEVGPEGLDIRLGPDVPPLHLAWAQVAAIEAKDPVVLVTATGDRLTGRITGMTDGRLELQTVHFGQVSLPIEGLAELETAAAEDSKSLKQALADLLAAQSKDGPEAKSILEPVPWKGRIRFAASLVSGNTDSVLLDFGARAEKVWEEDRFETALRVRYGETEDETTAAFGALAMGLDHYFEEKLYGFVRTELSRDEVQNLDFRGILTLGVGWTVWKKTDKEKLDLEAGIGALFEDFSSKNDSDFAPTLNLGLDYRDLIAEDVELRQTLELIAPVTDLVGFIARSRTSVVYPIGEDLSLDNSLELNYQNDPPDDTDALDVILSVGIEYRF